MTNTNLCGVSLPGLKQFERQVAEYLNEYFISERSQPNNRYFLPSLCVPAGYPTTNYDF